MIVEKNKRNYGIDLLRIVAMIMIITHHFLSHGKILQNLVDFDTNWYILWYVRTLCYTSVTIFFLISAFYQSKKTIGINGIVKLWLEVVFYSVICYLVSVYVGFEKFSILKITKSFFPISFRQYGFFNSYIIMSLMAPLLNILYNHINQKKHLLCVIVLVFICSVIPYITFEDFLNLNYGEGILWIILIYTIASYISKYYQVNKKIRYYILFGLLLTFIQYLSKIIISIITKIFFKKVIFSGAFIGETIFISLFASIMLFLGFYKLGEKLDNKYLLSFINIFSKVTFAVYLIHENNNIKYHFWDLIKPFKYTNNMFSLIMLWLVIVFSLFILAYVIEYIRNKINNIIDIQNKIVNKIINNRVYSYFNDLEVKKV